MALTERPSWIPEHLYPFESHYLDVHGARIHYVDEGTGPVLLFLHGNPTWSFLYRNFVLGLRDSFRCIALDLPGFGLSAAGEGYGHDAQAHAGAVDAFVTGLDLRGVTLIGQDWGGPVGLTVATRHPDRFKGFILGNTWAWRLNGILHFEFFARVMGSPIAKLAIGRANAFVNVMIPLGTQTKVSDEIMNAYRGPFNTLDSRRPTWEFPKELLRSEPFMRKLEEDLPKVTGLPALFVWGGNDFALRKRVELPRFESLFPRHETVVLEKARHFFQEDAPEEAVAAIRAWLSRQN